MEQDSIGSLLSLPFFLGLSKEEIKRIINNIKNNIINNNEQLIKSYEDGYVILLQSLAIGRDFPFVDREDILESIKIILVKYCNKSCKNIIKVLFNDEEANKINDLINRHQFNSKIIRQFICVIGYILSHIGENGKNKIADLINWKLTEELEKINEINLKKSFKPLVEVVDKVCSNVNTRCYKEWLYKSYSMNLDEELNNYIKEKYEYDFNLLNCKDSIYDFYKRDFSDHILCLALLNDEEFWKSFNGDNQIVKKDYCRGFLSFINLVLKYNSLKHATKLIDYCFNNILKNEKYNFAIKNKVPFFMMNHGYYDCLINNGINYTFERFSDLYDFDFTEEEKKNIFYPIYRAKIDNCFIIGKKIFAQFINNAYPDDAAKVLEIFSDTSIILKNNDSNPEYKITLEDILDKCIFGTIKVRQEKELLAKINSSFNDNESILNRFYYRIYLLNKYIGDDCYLELYEILYDALALINKKYKFRCTYINDENVRNERFEGLKTLLKKYGLNISKKYKKYYISALLDRKYATETESDLFPQLEQIGDAIYEFAVGNLMFFDTNRSCGSSIISNYVCAKEQIKVSKKIGLDQLYISSFHTEKINTKYSREELLKERKFIIDNNYIADSLEMLIGAIYIEFGCETSLNFAMKIIVDSNNLFKMPEKLYYSLEELYISNIDNKLKEKLIINPYLNNNTSDYYSEYLTLSQALSKVVNTLIIGTDTIEKRNKLTAKLYHLDFYGGKDFELLAYYLNYGLQRTIEFYEDFIKEKFN